MYKTSEWVSIGHPDKMADFISCYLLDHYLCIDPKTRYAVEVQIKDNFVTLGGEISSTHQEDPAVIAEVVRAAVDVIGYDKAYQKMWGKENTICGDDVVDAQHISQQSPDIAVGVNRGGWGDQGIFWGMAVNSPKTGYMPADWFLAWNIGTQIFRGRCSGLDIKTQVTLNDGKPEEIVVAAPMLYRHSEQDIKNIVQHCCGKNKDYNLVINGTGRFVKHGPIGDCGTTGRKLAVDFYGGNCHLGGGSPWTKDGTKADLSLNLLAREKALKYVKAHPECPEAHCSIACKIGSPEIIVSIYDAQNNELESYKEKARPRKLIQHFKLHRPWFANRCRAGLFSC